MRERRIERGLAAGKKCAAAKKGTAGKIYAVIAGLVFILLVPWLLADYLFHYIVCRKQWGLPKVLTRMIRGNDPAGGEPDPYDAEVEKRTEELKRIAEEEMEDLALTSFDGLKLKGKLWRAGGPSDKLILCVHGCRSSGLKEFCFAAPDYHRQGYHVLLVDQRACGESEGDYMSYGYYESGDIARWVRGIEDYFDGNIRIWLHGISMGGATVLMLSGMRRIRGIIADCSYTSAWEEFAVQLKNSFHLPEWPLLYLTDAVCRKKAGFAFKKASPLEAVRRAEVPVLLIHGEEDDYVPCHMARRLYERCASEKELFTVKGAVHARSYHTAAEEYLARVVGFVEKTK